MTCNCGTPVICITHAQNSQLNISVITIYQDLYQGNEMFCLSCNEKQPQKLYSCDACKKTFKTLKGRNLHVAKSRKSRMAILRHCEDMVKKCPLQNTDYTLTSLYK